ncbi:MAG: matrixin family metalloprotease [Deltaproteobacteria bacterium]|nr:matrixin family metalloprotease [Deltaproteobacteria bacterium]
MYKAIFTLAIMLASTQVLGFELRETDKGDFVRFHGEKIEMVLDPSLSLLGPTDEIESTIIDIFEMWVEKAELPLTFNFVHGTCGDFGYDQGGNNENCIAASTSKDMWKRVQSSDPGASAIVSYLPSTGAIIDADIVFNASDWKWSTSGEVENTLNLWTVTSHEVGHLLGLAHSNIEAAVMYPTTSVGKTGAEPLDSDDVIAATTLYENMLENTDLADCDGMATAAGGTPSSPFFFAGFLAMLFVRRRVIAMLRRVRS